MNLFEGDDWGGRRGRRRERELRGVCRNDLQHRKPSDSEIYLLDWLNLKDNTKLKFPQNFGTPSFEDKTKTLESKKQEGKLVQEQLITTIDNCTIDSNYSYINTITWDLNIATKLALERPNIANCPTVLSLWCLYWSYISHPDLRESSNVNMAKEEEDERYVLHALKKKMLCKLYLSVCLYFYLKQL